MEENAGGIVLGPFRMSFKVRRPTLTDRLWFAFDHRDAPSHVLWAIVRGRATGVHVFREYGHGTIFLNHGYADSRRSR